MAAVIVGVVTAILLSLGSGDAGGESALNWFFAKRFLDDGLFGLSARSPLLQPVLAPFTLLPYPWPPVVEMFLRAGVCFAAAAAVLSRLFPPAASLAMAVLWVPPMVLTAPLSQSYALAAGLLAVSLRLGRDGGHGPALGWSYCLLFLAWKLRSPYALLLGSFLLLDGIRLVTAWRRRLPLPRPSLLSVIPLVLVLGLSAWAGSHQSPHRWNNLFAVSGDWFPYPTREMGSAHLSQAMSYFLAERGEQPKDIPFDTWYLHKRLFGDAQTMGEVVRAAPVLFAEHVLRNLRGFVTTVAGITSVGVAAFDQTTHGANAVSAGAIDHRLVSVALGGASLLALLWLLRRLFWSGERERVVAVALVGLLLVATTGILVNGSKLRFAHSLFGLTLLAAPLLAVAVSRHRILVVGLILALSPAYGESGWSARWPAIRHGLAASDPLDAFYGGKNLSLFQAIDAFAGSCVGLMAHDVMTIATFTRFPTDRLYDIFEIPPFGRLGSGEYNGLRPERINCIYVSDQLSRSLSAGSLSVTNFSLRYQSYLAPYVEQLKGQGASTFTVAGGVLYVAPAVGGDR